MPAWRDLPEVFPRRHSGNATAASTPQVPAPDGEIEARVGVLAVLR
jgi:hypothetical protein